jgi:hypothetical protein
MPEEVSESMGCKAPTADTVLGNRASTTSSIELRLPDVPSGNWSDDAANAEEAERLAILKRIMLGILVGALVAAILTKAALR